MASVTLPRPPAPIAPRTLFLLGMAVLVAHALVLQDLSERLRAPSRLETRAFSTRSIALSPPAAAPQLPSRPISAVPQPAPVVKTPPRAEGVLAGAARLPSRQALAEAPAKPRMETPVQSPVPVSAASAALPEPEPVLADSASRTAVAPTLAGVGADASTANDSDAARAAAPAVAAVAPVPAANASAAATPSIATASSYATGQPSPAPVPAAAPRAAFAITVPGSAHLEYDAVGINRGMNYYATGELLWLHDGKAYEMQLKASAFGVGARVLASKGELAANGLAPRRYSDTRRSERATHFDRTRNRVVFSSNAPSVALTPGAQDRVSVFVQIVARVAGAPLDFPIGTRLQIDTADAREMLPWIFEVEREEMLELPDRQVPTLKLVRKPGRLYDQKIELWLAPELSYLPARIRITDANGNFMDQKWRASLPLPGAAQVPAAERSADLKTPQWPQPDR